jgi:prepilin-type N-terminal cleavage/methylation domain-containing protein
MRTDKKAVTLIELLISIVIFGLVVVGFMGIETFSRDQLISTERRSRLQNEAMLVLSHMNKQLMNAIGDVVNPPVTIAGNTVTIMTDTNRNGVNDVGDTTISYIFNGNTIVFNPPGETLASHVQAFNVVLADINYLNVSISTCWDPASPATCGTLSNPSVNMTSIMKMPSVSSQ